jgi:hypothetical protein
LSGHFVWPLCLATLSGHFVWPLCLATLSGPKLDILKVAAGILPAESAWPRV